jgi:valyl-tRNA synthetase
MHVRERIEDRWIVSRLQRAIESVSASLDSYDFAHAALDLYDFFWSELCDWYLEIVKPRLYDGDEAASATLLHVLGEVLALAHPMIPFVTEEVWSYMPGDREALVVSPYPVADDGLVDAEAEARVGSSIDLTRRVRRWRDLVGVAPGVTLPARVAGEAEPHEFVSRLARLSLDGAGGEALASFGSVEILGTDEVDAAEVRRRVSERLEELRSEIARAEGKLSNQGFAAKAPPDVVEAERGKLAAYRAELEELGG